MESQYLVPALLIVGIVAFLTVEFFKKERDKKDADARNKKLALLRSTPVTFEQATSLTVERERLQRERFRDRVLTVLFWISLLVAVLAVEAGRPRDPARQGLTVRQQVVAVVVFVLYSSVYCLMHHERGLALVGLWFAAPYGGGSATITRRLEEIEAQLSAPRQ